MSQESLAFKVGISQGYIAQLEMDNIVRRKSPKLSLILEISRALEVCPNDLVRFHCIGCEMEDTCPKRQYMEEDEDFFDDNLIYYL
jgi:predicted transcriptional regulator